MKFRIILFKKTNPKRKKKNRHTHSFTLPSMIKDHTCTATPWLRIDLSPICHVHVDQRQWTDQREIPFPTNWDLWISGRKMSTCRVGTSGTLDWPLIVQGSKPRIDVPSLLQLGLTFRVLSGTPLTTHELSSLFELPLSPLFDPCNHTWSRRRPSICRPSLTLMVVKMQIQRWKKLNYSHKSTAPQNLSVTLVPRTLFFAQFDQFTRAHASKMSRNQLQCFANLSGPLEHAELIIHPEYRVKCMSKIIVGRN